MAKQHSTGAQAGGTDTITLTLAQYHKLNEESIAACATAIEALAWLEGILGAIKKLSESSNNVAAMAGAGAYIAADFGNTVDCIRSDLEAVFAEVAA